MRGKIFGTLGAIAGALVLAFVVLFFVAGRAYRMPSSAMEPTLHCARPAPGCTASQEDRFLVLKWIGFGRRDIVAFKTPLLAQVRCGAGGTYIKRVIGLPGETVSERNGYIYIDGKKLSEPYVKPDRRDQMSGSWRVPKNAYFVLGDNRAQSCDSRIWGSVPAKNVVGRLAFIYWPLSRIGSR